MSRSAWLLVGAAAFVCVVLVLPVLMFVVVLGGGSNSPSDCTPPGDVELAEDAGLSAEQLANAAAVVSVGNELGIPRRGIVVALAVASQESGFRNYANDGQGGDLAYSQQGIEASLNLPHEAVGTDHGSLGIFQQQWPWWGTMTELMDPATAAEKFYEALVEVPGWQELPVTVAGQAVQRSAFPDAYADDQALAERLLAGSEGSVVPAFSTDCAPGSVAPGTVVFPLPPGSGYVDRANWGDSGGRWAAGHTGTDLSVACGTPVLAATDGTIVLDTDQAWAGNWLVQVSTGPGRLTTWYAHLQSVTVSDGDVVAAGEQIGTVGALGNATGCHLHFEVHPEGGSIYADDVDPTRWLAAYGGRDVTALFPADGSPDSTGASAGFTVATFNVLGHSHTVPGGDRPGYASSRTRTDRAVSALHRHGVDLVGLQEFQRPQKARLQTLAGDEYALWHPPGDTENAIAWRRDRFRLLGADSFGIRYYVRIRRMPVVRLEDRATGRQLLVVNVHNPANSRLYPGQVANRAAALRRELALIHDLAETTGLPVLFLGDLNARDRAFCAATRTGLLHAAAGGSTGPTCRPPTAMGIDWIFGTRDITFTSHRAIDDPRIDNTTDHPLVLARADLR
jgi:murein DD-endopeptidase MepM/ murein hydrolase activator NlpD/endonuclease/exonuclease/phosphatase family metal-dependent hydrolase